MQSGGPISRAHQLFDLARPLELSIPESWRTPCRSVSNATSMGFVSGLKSERSDVFISSRAVLKCWLLMSSMVRKAKACASGTPSAPLCRNSMCAFTCPKTVPKTICPTVPSGIGPFTSRADPPVNESRCTTPTIFWLSTVKIAFCRWGTRIRGGRCLRDFSMFRGIVGRITNRLKAVNVT